MRSRSQTPGNGSETVRSVRQVFPEFLHAGEEAGGFGGGVATFAGRLELAQQFPLLLGEVDRRLDGDLDVHVAERLGAQHRHALALEAELLVRLRDRKSVVQGKRVSVSVVLGGRRILKTN